MYLHKTYIKPQNPCYSVDDIKKYIQGSVMVNGFADKHKLLIIEDDKSISELLELSLTDLGYDVQIAETLAEAHNLELSAFSLIILDIGLPDGDGKSLLGRIQSSGTPVIVLTARNTLLEKVKSFDLGADDYLSKPFEMQELTARIKALLRRTNRASSVLEIEDIRIHKHEHLIKRGGNVIEVTSKEWNLLVFMIENRGMVLSRDRLLEMVWGLDFPGSTRTVDVHIQQLRKKLGIKSITTVHKEGYRLER